METLVDTWTIPTSLEHLLIVAEHYGEPFTVDGDMVTMRRQLEGIGTLTYMAVIS